MRVAIISSGTPTGGVARYERELQKIITSIETEVDFVYINSSKFDQEILKFNFFKKINFILNFLRSTIFGFYLLKKINLGISKFEKALIKEQINIIWFISPNYRALGMKKIPFIVTEWDIGHRHLPYIGEIASDGKFEIREFYNKKIFIKATFIIVDSFTTQENLIREYGVNKNKIFISGLPLSPEDLKVGSLDINKIIKISKPYLIYPAKFWKHKNHILIIEACKILQERNQNFKILFVGHKAQEYDSIKKLIFASGLNNNMEILLDAERDDLNLLIQESNGLLMPSLLGPTNYPIYEALSLGVPVLASNAHEKDLFLKLPGIILLNPLDAELWACEIEKLILNKSTHDKVFFDNTDNINFIITNILQLKNYV